jgi:hypothetical protein
LVGLFGVLLLLMVIVCRVRFQVVAPYSPLPTFGPYVLPVICYRRCSFASIIVIYLRCMLVGYYNRVYLPVSLIAGLPLLFVAGSPPLLHGWSTVCLPRCRYPAPRWWTTFTLVCVCAVTVIPVVERIHRHRLPVTACYRYGWLLLFAQLF